MLAQWPNKSSAFVEIKKITDIKKDIDNVEPDKLLSNVPTYPVLEPFTSDEITGLLKEIENITGIKPPKSLVTAELNYGVCLNYYDDSVPLAGKNDLFFKIY